MANAWFQKADGHLITYRSGLITHNTQIDYFLVRRRNLKDMKNCKVLSGENLMSLHRLLVMEVDISIRLSKHSWRAALSQNKMPFAGDERLCEEIKGRSGG